MNRPLNQPNRRDFIVSAAGGITAFEFCKGLFQPPYAYGAASSTVAVVRSKSAVTDRNECNPKQLRLMIDRGLRIITGKENPKDAWFALGITKNDVVGIKVNCNSWTFLLTTHPDLVYALCESLSTVIPLNNIVIYERDSAELSRAGYKVNTSASGIRCYGTNEGGGFHPQEGLTRILTDTCTKIINIPSLKTVEGEFAGSLFLKNHIGSIHHSKMPDCHGNAIFCTEVCAKPGIRNKSVLAICDGLRGTYKRGVPWYWQGLIISKDMVAAEYAAIQAINEKRKEEKEAALSIPDYVNAAETKGLGNANPTNIKIISAML